MQKCNLYNALGQMLSDDRFGKSTLYSKDLTNMEAAYIIVKVINNDQIDYQGVHFGLEQVIVTCIAYFYISF